MASSVELVEQARGSGGLNYANDEAANRRNSCPGEGKGYALQYSGLEVPWTVCPMGSQRVGHDWATVTFTFMQGRLGKMLTF